MTKPRKRRLGPESQAELPGHQDLTGSRAATPRDAAVCDAAMGAELSEIERALAALRRRIEVLEGRG